MATGMKWKEPAKARRNKGELDGKPLIDHSLASMGAALKDLTTQRNEIDRKIRAIQFEQDCRVAELQAEQHLTWIDAGDHRMILSGSPQRNVPSDHQMTILRAFGAALTIAPKDLLDELYGLAIHARCEFTNWQSPYGEDLETAYRRRSAEIDAKAS